MFDLVILIFLFVLNKIKYWTKRIYVHFSEFFTNDQDPVKECDSVEQIPELLAKRPLANFLWMKISLHFLPAALAILYFHLDNLYIIFVHYDGNYTATGMPEFLLHRITQQMFWDLMDVLVSAGMAQAVLIFVFLTRQPHVDSEYYMFAVWNESLQRRTIYYRGKCQTAHLYVILSILAKFDANPLRNAVWKQSKSDQLLKRRARLRRIYTILKVPVWLQLYFYYVFYHVVKGNLLTCRNMWILLYMHTWTIYVAYADIYISFYFHLVSNYIQLKQQCKLNKINALMDEMALVAQGKHPNKNIPLLRSLIWNKFCKCNGKILILFKEIGVFNRFWSLILTVYVFGYVIMICYLAYALLQMQVDVITKKSLHIFFTIQFMITTLLLTSLCAAIVRKNVTIYKNNRRFAYLFSRTLQPTDIQLLKLSKMVSNYKGTRNGFRYINGGIIDSRMFQILFLSMSVLYMKIFKKKVMGKDFIG